MPGRKRVIVEKPFGKDLASAHALNPSLLSIWSEDEIDPAMLNQPRSATVRAVSSCDLLVLDAEDFRCIIADFPQAEADLRRIAASRR